MSGHRAIWTGSSQTLAEIQFAEGYGTVAVLEKRFGIDPGVDVDDDRGTAGSEFSHRRGRDVTAAALAAVARLPVDRPYFLWVHDFEPHAPYLPPAGGVGSFRAGSALAGGVA